MSISRAVPRIPLRSPLAVLLDRPSRCVQTFAGWRRCNPGDQNVALCTLQVFPLRKRPHWFGPDDVVHGRRHFHSTATRANHQNPAAQIEGDDGISFSADLAVSYTHL